MLDPRTARNIALIAKLNLQIMDDEIETARIEPHSRSKARTKKSLSKSPTCTCSARIIDGVEWTIVSLECFDHGLFGNREVPEKAMDFNLSRHPYAE